MENILIKALKEVLTPLYSEELRDAYDTGYTPTADFENEMRALAAKTDRSGISRYTRCIMAAAAVIIAVGVAVIVPSILNNRVEVMSPDVTSSGSESTEASVVSGTLQINDDTGFATTSAAETSDTTIPAVSSVTVETSSISDTSPSVETQPPVSLSSEAASVVSDDDDVNPGAGANTVDDTTDIVTDYYVSVGDEDADDDLSLDSDDDNNDYDDGDDAVIISDTDSAINIAAKDGETLAELFAENSINVSFDDLYALTADYIPDNSIHYSISMSLSEHAFIQEFVHKLGSAAAKQGDLSADGGRVLQLSIHDFKPGQYALVDRYYNWSAWVHYSDFFGTSEEDDTTGDEEDPDVTDDNKDTIGFGVKIHENTGAVEIYGILWYKSTNGGSDGSYRINSTFFMDKETVAKLFADIDKVYLPESAGTVSDITSAFGLTSENITQSVSYVRGIYDTNLENGRTGSYVTDLLSRYSEKKLKKVTNGFGTSPITLRVITKDDHDMFIDICTDGYIYISDPIKTTYRFKYDKREIEKALKAIADANGFSIPEYSTLGEYLSDKNFTGISKIEYYDGISTTYTLEDAEELKAFTKLFKAEFKTARYTYDPSETSGSGTVKLFVPGYMNYIYVHTDGNTIMIRTNTNNWFKPSDGFAEKLFTLLKENAKTKVKTNESEADTVDDTDDDVNPIT